MTSAGEILIRVHPEWNGWQTAAVRLGDLEEVRWARPEGAPRDLVHGYVHCDRVVTGELPHDCAGTRPPHRLLVCILKRHTVPAVYDDLVQRANGNRSPG